jgi:hypothetical protein
MRAMLALESWQAAPGRSAEGATGLPKAAGLGVNGFAASPRTHPAIASSAARAMLQF